MFSINNWQQGKKWTNWCEHYLAYPNYYAPASIDEVSSIVKTHGASKQTIRVTGAAHSFSPVALPEQSALTLHYLRGLIAVDTTNLTATFYAGTYLHEIGPLLADYGLALINMGDIQVQTLAGAISTGTHGTGVTLGSFASMVTNWGFINGLGEYVEHSRGDDELSEALAVSVGLLGILVNVTIRVIPLYSLAYKSERKNIYKELIHFQTSIRENRHVEWFYFPGSDTIQVKTMNSRAAVAQGKWQKRLDELQIQLLENNVFYLASELCKWKPSLSKHVSQLSSNVITETERVGLSYNVYPSPRNVKFVETEYAIPLTQFEACMEEIHHLFKRGTFDVHFPIECRTTAGEAGFLSPTQQQESAFLSFHMYKGMDERPYFNWVHTMIKKYGGRAHWGKLNRYADEPIEAYYPQAAAFNKIRQLQDPHNVFLTSYFKKIFK